MDHHAPYPEFFRVRQTIEQQSVDDVSAAVYRALESSSLREQVKPKQMVAIAVGSRGIADLKTIVAQVVTYVHEIGGQPIIIPSMGSHGGATAEGQSALLASLGIDSSMREHGSKSPERMLLTRAKVVAPLKGRLPVRSS